MFGDMMGKLQEMKQKVEESKVRLNNVIVQGQAENGAITVDCTGNNKVVAIKIDPVFFKEAEVDDIEELMIVAMNRALDNAEEANKAEVAGAAGGMMPGMGV
jgi:DNA-binding YbaB/EbfC family protein